MKQPTLSVWFVSLVALGPVAFGDANAADVFLETSRSEFQTIPIWIMGFADGETEQQNDTEIGKQIIDVLQADLRRTQVFEVIDQPTKLFSLSQAGCRGKAPLAKAKESAASVVTWGRIGRKDGKLAMEACAYDGGQTDRIAVGKRYLGGPITMRLLRLMVHRWADELVSHYTGESGIARTKILYVASEVETDVRNVFVMDYDGFGPRPVTSDRKLSLMPTWSPDQRSVVYTTYRQNEQELMWLDLGTGKKRSLVPPGTLNMTPSFSPDGRFLAYASTKGGNSDIFMLDLKTHKKKQLTSHPKGDLSPTWSPSGRELAFTSDRKGGPQIYVMHADDSSDRGRRLTFEGNHNAAPAWSPRGDWIAYVCHVPGDGYKLCRISPDGERRFQMTSGPPSEIDDSPSWAPDGRHLVFSSNRDGQSHIYMIHLDGTGLEQVTKGERNHSSPAWSP